MRDRCQRPAPRPGNPWASASMAAVRAPARSDTFPGDGAEGGSGSRRTRALRRPQLARDDARAADRKLREDDLSAGRRTMGKVRTGLSVSLDGFISGPNDGPEAPMGVGGDRLLAWYSAGDTEYKLPGTDMVFMVSAQTAAY